MNKTVTLHCKEGNHHWERPSKRGRLPQNCPDHTPNKIASTANPTSALQEGRTRKAEANRRDTILEIISHARASTCRCGITPDMTDEELKKMTGCTSPHFVCGTLDSIRRSLGI